MSAKKWLAMFAVVILLSLGLYAGINIAVDPFGAFGDPVFHWYSYDETNNPRIAKLAYLEEHHEEYDSYIIGSSSAASYDPELLDQYTGNRYYNLFTYGGDTSIFVDEVRYLLEHYEVRHILLNLGLNEANLYRQPCEDLTDYAHAKASGENLPLFYTKLAFGSFSYTSEKLRSYFKDTELPQVFDVFDTETGCYDKRVRDVERIGDLEKYMDEHGAAFNGDGTMSTLEHREDCAASVREIKRLCQAHGAELSVVFSPVYISQWQETDPDAIAEYKRQIAEITDYWDFSYSSVSFECRYFYDNTHFRNAVGAMLIARMFEDETVYAPEDFGTYVTQDTVEELLAAYNGIAPRDLADYSVDIPVLMYHHLAQDASGATVVTPETFRAQMKAISAMGANTVSIDELYRYVYYGDPLPGNPVLITFDDGYLSNYEIACPILRELGMKATVFAIGTSIGHDTYKNTDFPIIPHFDYAQINDMLKSGVMDVQSHSYDMHQWEPFEDGGAARVNILRFDGERETDYMEALYKDTVIYQREFAEKTGVGLKALAYPSGVYDTLSEVVLHSAGIPITFAAGTESANTLVKGLPQTLYALGRMAVTEETSDTELRAYILGAKN